jgi:CRISPR-associated protein Cmr2
MYEAFWHRKIQGICKNLNFDSLKNQQNNLAAPYWHQLEKVLTEGPNQWRNEIQLADQIADASDRFVLNQIPFNFNAQSSTVAHLLSGNGLDLALDGNSLLAEGENINAPPKINNSDNESDISLRELFWWLWRCLPEIASQEFNESILLIPARSLSDLIGR